MSQQQPAERRLTLCRQAWSSIDKGIRDPSDEEYKRWAKDEHQNLDQNKTGGAEQGDSTACGGHQPTIKGGQPYVEDFTDEDEAQLDDEISGIEIPGLASLQPEKHSSANQTESLEKSSTRKPQPLPTKKPGLVGDAGIAPVCGCKSGTACSCSSGQCHCKSGTACSCSSGQCHCKSGTACSCSGGRCHCKSSDDVDSEASNCCSSGCKCGQDCACAPGQCSCQKAETTFDTLNEHTFTRPSQPQSPVRSSSPLKNFYTPREQPPVIESDDSSPIPPKPQMTPIGRPDTPRPVDSSPGVSPIRQSVEPEFPRHMIRESTPAYVDRSPSPSPVSQRGDVEMGNATPPAPYHGPESPVGADSLINSAFWTFTSTFRPHKLVQLHHDTTRYRQTIEYHEGLLIERTQRWNSAKQYDEDVRRHRLLTNTTGQAATYPVQVEVEVDRSYPVSPAHPYQTEHQVLTAEFFHRHGLDYEAVLASTYGEDEPDCPSGMPQSAPVISSSASGSVHQGPSSAPPAILTTWPGQKPIAFPINPLYHFLTTANPGSQVSVTFKFLPRNPIERWTCIDQSGTGHEALIHELCQSERVVSAPPRGLPPQPQPLQPTYPQSQWGALPPPPPILTSPTPTSPSTLRPSKTRDTPSKKDNSRRKSLGVAGGKIEKQKPRSVTSGKGSRKPTAGTKAGKSKVGDAVKKIEAAEMKGNRVVTEGSRRSARIRQKVERMSSSPAPES